jgi:DNA helicase IV
MLSRRSLSGSMTVVGDIAQATGPFAPRRWEDQLTHLPTRRGAQQVSLTVNYRTPAEIMELAGRVLAVAAPWLAVPESVRTGDAEPRRIPVRSDQRLGDAVAAAVAAEQEAVGAGTVAVVTPGSLVAPVSEALVAAGLDHQVASVRSDLSTGVTVLPVEAVKGLEFDAVVVVEPARIVRENAQGLRSLFVALTRPTQRLALVHAEPLPDPLR